MFETNCGDSSRRLEDNDFDVNGKMRLDKPKSFKMKNCRHYWIHVRRSKSYSTHYVVKSTVNKHVIAMRMNDPNTRKLGPT